MSRGSLIAIFCTFEKERHTHKIWSCHPISQKNFWHRDTLWHKPTKPSRSSSNLLGFMMSRDFSDSFIWNQLLTLFIWRRLLTIEGGEGGVIECCVRLQQRLLVWWHLCALRAIALNELIRSSFVPIVVACYVTAAGVYCVTWRVWVLCNFPRFDAPGLIRDDNHLLHLLDSTQ